MEITYKTRKLERICTNLSEAKKQYGYNIAVKLNQRLNEILASDTVEEMIKYKIGRCHKLEGDRKDEYAVDLIHPYRLVFKKIGEEIQVVKIWEIVDYH